MVPTLVENSKPFCVLVYTVFTWLNTVVFITLVPKIDVATIQTRPPLDTREQYLSHYFHNQLWDYSSAATIKDAAFNQVNTVYISNPKQPSCKKSVRPSERLW